MLDKSGIHKILVVSLTNIGDVILTFPVIDRLRAAFPLAKLTVVIGPKAVSLLEGNPHFAAVDVFDKRQSPWKSLSWVRALRRERFDLVVDLRNTAIPFMIAPRCRTSCRAAKDWTGHMRDKHLERLTSAVDCPATDKRFSVSVSPRDRQYVDELIDKEIGRAAPYVVMAPGAADTAKRWNEEGFVVVGNRLAEDRGLRLVFVGDEEDRKVAQRVGRQMETEPVNLCGRLNLIQLAALMERAALAVTNDSAPAHLASYLDIPVLVLFGPTDARKYGPWGTRGKIVQKGSDMRAITPDDVLAAAGVILSPKGEES